MRLLFTTLLLFFCLFASPSFLQGQVASRASERVENSNNEPDFSFDNDKIVFTTPGAADKLEIFALIGTKVAVYQLDKNRKELTLNLPKGYYIVRYGNAVKKIAIK